MSYRMARIFLVAALVTLIPAISGILPGSNSSTTIAKQPSTQQAAAQQPDSLSAAEFSRLSRELSEDGGYFRSDNFTSNETPYLHIVDKLKALGASGGAYVGVGPEQNFTYIAKIRPKFAVLIDIRRQAIIQHLMYKAIFHHSPTRAQFLSFLLSRPIPKEKIQTVDGTAPELVAFFEQGAADERSYTTNLALIRKTIQEDFQYPLSVTDVTSLEFVYRTFKTEGLDIAFRIDNFGDPGRGGYFPGLKDLMVQTDLNGKMGNFLASKDDYEYVKNLHKKNMIIMVVGDFGGKKALAAIGDYLSKSGYTVSAFYTSNVEQYLFESGSFDAFANNVRRLPINDKSLFIRSASGRYPHPARLPGHRSATLMQKIGVFLKDFDEGRYKSHYDLVTTNYIAPSE